MTERLLAVDGNSIGYASHHGRKLHNNGMEIQAVFGFLKTIQKLLRTMRTATTSVRPLILWDKGCDFREALYPEYKSQRDVDPKKAAERLAYKAQVPHIRELLSLLGVDQMDASGFEADDLAGLLVRTLSPDKKITLITGDHDWLQLINRPSVTWHDPRRDGIWVKHADFKEFTGWDTPGEFLIEKAIIGDTSDNITGVKGVGPKCVLEMADHFGSVENTLRLYVNNGAFTKQSVPEDFNTRFVNPMNNLCKKEGREVLVRNIQLMTLMDSKHDKEMRKAIKVVKQETDMDGFFKRCLELNFATITSRPKLWTDTFGVKL